MVTIKQRIKLLVHVKISVVISVQFQETPISDIANFAISAANILPIQYISTPLVSTYITGEQEPGRPEESFDPISINKWLCRAAYESQYMNMINN